MFTKVLLLSRGRLVFYGDREATLLYFSRLGRPCPPFTSVPEFLLELLVKQQLNLGEPSEDLSDLTPEKYACIPIVKRTLVVLGAASFLVCFSPDVTYVSFQ